MLNLAGATGSILGDSCSPPPRILPPALPGNVNTGDRRSSASLEFRGLPPGVPGNAGMRQCLGNGWKEDPAGFCTLVLGENPVPWPGSDGAVSGETSGWDGQIQSSAGEEIMDSFSSISGALD